MTDWCASCGGDIFKKVPNPFGTTNYQPNPMFSWWHRSNAQGLVSVACDNTKSDIADPIKR